MCDEQKVKIEEGDLPEMQIFGNRKGLPEIFVPCAFSFAGI